MLLKHHYKILKLKYNYQLFASHSLYAVTKSLYFELLQFQYFI